MDGFPGHDLMNQELLEKSLANLSLSGIRYYHTVGSTNDIAAQWAMEAAEDFSLVIADEQTAGRGRAGRTWFTNPGSGLALSLILRPGSEENEQLSALTARYTGLGALAVCRVLQRHYSLPVQIKWPNDVLINRRKCCGVLVEAHWDGDLLSSLILGIGVNISKDAIPALNHRQIAATSVSLETSSPVNRLEFLRQLLTEIVYWRPHLEKDVFRQSWESNLAFLGEQVRIMNAGESSKRDRLLAIGQITGLNKDGALLLKNKSGETLVVYFGDIIENPDQGSKKFPFNAGCTASIHLRPDEKNPSGKKSADQF
jgi:BirA family biotin operon repressor/biotin-[acetyl-CoA-carboxylase] ligase